jgi:hypothetical protein
MLKIAVGQSNDPLSRAAIAEVIEQCRSALADHRPQAGILMAGVDFDHVLLLAEIHEAFPGVALIGCTTAGEIASVMDYQQDSIVLTLIASDTLEICAGLGRAVTKDPAVAVAQAVEMAASPQPAQFCLALPEGGTNGEIVVAELKQALGPTVPIFGGKAGAHNHDAPTYVFYQNEVLQDGLPILIFRGAVLFSHGVANGWTPIGNTSQVTAAQDNVVYRIGDRTPLEFYQSYLGQAPTEEYPLALFEPEDEAESLAADPAPRRFYTRSPIGCDPITGSVTFAGNVPTGLTVQITEATKDEILAAAETSICQALRDYPGQQPAVVLFFSCFARRYILAGRTFEEYELAKHHLPAGIVCAGFYTFGEISPLGGETLFHNETFVTLMLGER